MCELTVFLRDYIAPVFEKYGFVCLIEPLSECNFLKTLDDGLVLAKAVDRPSIKLLADFYHVFENREPLSGYKKYSDWLRHAHVASPNNRIWPRANEDYSQVFSALKEAGYDGGISIEGRRSDNRSLYDEDYEALSSLRASYKKVF